MQTKCTSFLLPLEAAGASPDKRCDGLCFTKCQMLSFCVFSCLFLSPVSPARLGRVTGRSSDRTHSFETTCVCSARVALHLFRFAHPTSLCHAFAWPDFLCLFFACDFALILFCLFYFCLPISPVLPEALSSTQPLALVRVCTSDEASGRAQRWRSTTHISHSSLPLVPLAVCVISFS